MPTASPQPVRCSKVTQAASAAMRSRRLQHNDSDVILVVSVRWRHGRQKNRACKLHWASWPDDGGIKCSCGGAWKVAVADEVRHTLPP
jgi:hypothetical protein